LKKKHDGGNDTIEVVVQQADSNNTTTSYSNSTSLSQQQQEEAQRKFQQIMENSKTERVRRMHMNLIENVLPYLMAVVMLYFSKPNEIAAAVVMSTFTVMRLLYHVCYFFGLQPFRSIFFFLGLLNTIGIFGYAIVQVFISN